MTVFYYDQGSPIITVATLLPEISNINKENVFIGEAKIYKQRQGFLKIASVDFGVVLEMGKSRL